MTIAISNLTVADNVPPGTIVGVLTAKNTDGVVLPCSFTVSSNPDFAISGKNLVTKWSGSINPGSHSVRITAKPISFSGQAFSSTFDTGTF